MAQVSRRRLNERVETKVFELFSYTIARLTTPSSVVDFFDDFLTPTERIMLAKRLSVALMLIKGYDYRTIQSVLKVSLPTVASVSVWIKYRGKGYQKVLENVVKEEKFVAIIGKIDEIIGNIIQVVPPKGANWSLWKRKQWETKINSGEAF